MEDKIMKSIHQLCESMGNYYLRQCFQRQIVAPCGHVNTKM